MEVEHYVGVAQQRTEGAAADEQAPSGAKNAHRAQSIGRLERPIAQGLAHGLKKTSPVDEHCQNHREQDGDEERARLDELREMAPFPQMNEDHEEKAEQNERVLRTYHERASFGRPSGGHSASDCCYETKSGL